MEIPNELVKSFGNSATGMQECNVSCEDSSVMPRSHSGEGATMISANIEEQRRLQIRQNLPKKKRESVVT